jgi:FlaA1/EpsC-like NDP-sugar epimerase
VTVCRGQRFGEAFSRAGRAVEQGMNAGNEIDDFFQDRRVMVTGACGTVGRALLTRLEQSPAQGVIGLDHAESAVFELGRRFDGARVSVRLGDVGQREPLIERFRDVDVVLHMAAYKPGAVQGQ